MGRVNNHIDYVEFPAKDIGELEKVKEAIKPYYNKDEYIIYFSELGWKD